MKFTRTLTILPHVAILTAASVVLSTPSYADEVRGSSWWLDGLDINEAHDITTGEGVTIGLIDSGVDIDHPDLVGSVEPGWSSWSNSSDDHRDVSGHGTAMASLLVGHGHGDDDTDGVLGIAPGARLISAAIEPSGINDDTGEKYYDHEDLRGPVEYFLKNPVDVIVIPFANTPSSPVQEMVHQLFYADITVITPLGSTDDEPDTTGLTRYGTVIPTRACNIDTSPIDTNRQSYGTEVTVPIDESLTVPAPGDGYTTLDGPSHDTSAAILGGVAALMKSQWPDMPPDMIRHRIFETATPPTDPPKGANYGAGILEPLKALTETVEPDPNNPDLDPNPEPDPREPTPTTNPTHQATTPPEDDTRPWPLTTIIGGAITLIVITAITTTAYLRRRNTSSTNDEEGQE